MGIAPFVAGLFLFCCVCVCRGGGGEGNFVLFFSEDDRSGVVTAFGSASRYLDDLLNIGNNFFDSMVSRIYPSELQLNKANVSDTEASFFYFTFIYIGWFCEN